LEAVRRADKGAAETDGESSGTGDDTSMACFTGLYTKRRRQTGEKGGWWSKSKRERDADE
jgi:phage gp46-like protein